jgi:hypothetical protein
MVAVIGSRSRVDVFKNIDTNNDGYIDQNEFYAAMEALKMPDLTDKNKKFL